MPYLITQVTTKETMDSTTLVCVANGLKAGRAAELPAFEASKEHFEAEAVGCTDDGELSTIFGLCSVGGLWC